jgi:hypothetical protein
MREYADDPAQSALAYESDFDDLASSLSAGWTSAIKSWATYCWSPASEVENGK